LRETLALIPAIAAPPRNVIELPADAAADKVRTKQKGRSANGRESAQNAENWRKRTRIELAERRRTPSHQF